MDHKPFFRVLGTGTVNSERDFFASYGEVEVTVGQINSPDRKFIDTTGAATSRLKKTLGDVSCVDSYPAKDNRIDLPIPQIGGRIIQGCMLDRHPAAAK